MEPFKFSPINWDKVTTGHIGICYSKDNWLADLEIAVQEPEAVRLGIPKGSAIGTHVWIPFEVENEPLILTRSKWFGLEKQTITLVPGKYVFQETITGDQESDLIKTYGDSTNIEIRRRMIPFTQLGKKAIMDSIIKNWKMSYAYGWLAFVTEPIHTILGKDVEKKTTLGSEICSALAATIINDACRAEGFPLDFTDEYNTNPLEWQVNPNWERDTDVQPLN